MPGLVEARIDPETLGNWVGQAEIKGASDPARRPTTDDAQRLIELERESRELRGANEILEPASAFFAQAELDRRLK